MPAEITRRHYIVLCITVQLRIKINTDNLNETSIVRNNKNINQNYNKTKENHEKKNTKILTLNDC